MSNGAATMEAGRASADTARISARGASVGFSVGRMLAVARKELQSYFAFPLVYILLGLFAFMAGLYAWTDLDFFETIAFAKDIIQNYWQLLFTDLRFCFLLTLPFLTMRLFAEERKLGTIELLYTYPLRDGEILGGKFLASEVIMFMMLGLTLLYPVYLHSIHRFPIFPLVSGYLGLVLMGTAFVAFGVFVSSLCESQVVAGIGTILPLLFFWVMNWNETSFQGNWTEAIRAVSLFDNFGGFAKGVIDLDHVTYFIFFIVFFIYLTLRSMEARKWTGRR